MTRATGAGGREKRRRQKSIAALAHVLPQALVGMLAMLALVSCHPLVNPADPNSVNYTGVPTSSNPDPSAPDPVLPEAVKWEVVADHAPGRPLPLTIPESEDPVFVEPRTAPMVYVRVTLADSFRWEDADGAIVWYALADTSGRLYYGVGGFTDVRPEERRLYIRADAVPVPISNGSILRARIIDRKGVIAGERLIGILNGDVDGNGVVQFAADDAAIFDVAGFTVSEANPETIRADVDVNGVVEHGLNDSGIVSAMDGTALTTTIPEFWD